MLKKMGDRLIELTGDLQTRATLLATIGACSIAMARAYRDMLEKILAQSVRSYREHEPVLGTDGPIGVSTTLVQRCIACGSSHMFQRLDEHAPWKGIAHKEGCSIYAAGKALEDEDRVSSSRVEHACESNGCIRGMGHTGPHFAL